MIIFDGCLYLGLAWVIDALVSDPLAFGRDKRLSTGRDGEREFELSDMASSASQLGDMETGGKTADAAVGISIRGLSKRFSWKDKAEGIAGHLGQRVERSVQAVDGLEIEIAARSIFCLLGSNGAGKTTTAGLLTGLIAPDSGTAQVAGFDIVRNREEMRQNLGMCPQHDILYDGLTATEQLLLYGCMQGLADHEAQLAARELLTAVGLHAKANDLASQMSGGQRRRLSLASSLIGSPAVIFRKCRSSVSASRGAG